VKLLLVSAGIALAEFGKSGDPEFIFGYRLLKYLGREVTTTLDGRDQWDGRGSGDALPTGAISQSTFIKDWVITGRKPDDSLELLRLLQSELDKDPDRRAALIATVEKVRAEYAAIWVQDSSVEWQNLPETWELKEDIAWQAFHAVVGALVQYCNESRIIWKTRCVWGWFISSCHYFIKIHFGKSTCCAF
jgi:hypothetical protein